VLYSAEVLRKLKDSQGAQVSAQTPSRGILNFSVPQSFCLRLSNEESSNNKSPNSVPSPLPRAARIAGEEGRVRGKE